MSWLVLVQAQVVAPVAVAVAVLYIVGAFDALVTPWLMGCLGGGLSHFLAVCTARCAALGYCCPSAVC